MSKLSSLQVRADGTFDVICLDGSTSNISAQDLADDRACGGPQIPPAISGMRAAIRIAPTVLVFFVKTESLSSTPPHRLKEVFHVLASAEL